MANASNSEGQLPPSLRLLRGLVMLLLVSMIGAVITLVWLFVTRMPDSFTPNIPALPAITLPAGETAQAVTTGPGWVMIVAQSNRIFVYDTEGTLRQELHLNP